MRKFVQFLLAGLLLLSIGVNAIPQTAQTKENKYVQINVDRKGRMTDAEGKPISKYLFPETTYDEKGEKKFNKGTATKRPKVMYIDESTLNAGITPAVKDTYKEFIAAEPKVVHKSGRNGIAKTGNKTVTYTLSDAQKKDIIIGIANDLRTDPPKVQNNLSENDRQAIIDGVIAKLKEQHMLIGAGEKPVGSQEEPGFFTSWVINPVKTFGYSVGMFFWNYFYWIIAAIIVILLLVYLRSRSRAGKPGLIRIVRDQWSSKEVISSVTPGGASTVQRALYNDEEIAKDLKAEKSGWGAAEKLQIVNEGDETAKETSSEGEKPDQNQVVLKPLNAEHPI